MTFRSTMSLRERFETKYIPEPNSGCWLWLATVDPKGYGRLTIRKRPVGAHRVSYALHHNCPVNVEGFICHHCDNSYCVNPEHLYLGNPASNVDDMMRRGRNRPGGKPQPGEQNPRAVLTEADVLRIRKERPSIPSRQLARRYGVSNSAIERIRNRTYWKHLREVNDVFG